MPGTRASRPAPKDLDELLLALLAFGSGAVDAISFLGLGRVFTANMTGNIVLLGLAASRSEGSEAIRSAISLAVFIVGVYAATWIAARSGRQQSWRSVRIPLAIEVACQAALLGAWAATAGRPGLTLEAVLVGLSALAMGLQSGAVRARDGDPRRPGRRNRRVERPAPRSGPPRAGGGSAARRRRLLRARSRPRPQCGAGAAARGDLDRRGARSIRS